MSRNAPARGTFEREENVMRGRVTVVLLAALALGKGSARRSDGCRSKSAVLT
jgi:hypothetical protein